MAGIDSLVNSRADMFANNPQGLQQRYAQSQDLLDLLALQKLKQEKEAAMRNLQMQAQAPATTVKEQLEGQVLDMTKREVAQQVAPGLAMQGQRMAQAAPRQQARPTPSGVATLPAPNFSPQMMAGGGIVAFADGGMPEKPAESQMDIDIRMLTNAQRVANDPNAPEETRRRAQMEIDRIKAQSGPDYMKILQEMDRRRGDYPGLTRGGIVGYAEGDLIEGDVEEQDAAMNIPAGGLAAVAPPRTVDYEQFRPAAYEAPEPLAAQRSYKDIMRELYAAPAQGKPSAYERELERLQSDEKDKLDILASWLQGAGGKRSIAGALGGAGKALGERQSGIRKDIRDVTGRIESFNTEQQRAEDARRQNAMGIAATLYGQESADRQKELDRRQAAAEAYMGREFQWGQKKMEAEVAAVHDKLTQDTQIRVAEIYAQQSKVNPELEVTVQYLKSMDPTLTDVEAQYLALRERDEHEIAQRTAGASMYTFQDALGQASDIVDSNLLGNLELTDEERAKKIMSLTDMLMARGNRAPTQPTSAAITYLGTETE